jgi:hypothetical protein
MQWMGKGNKEAADAAACDAIRGMFDITDICGEVVIGEGIKDEAPGFCNCSIDNGRHKAQEESVGRGFHESFPDPKRAVPTHDPHSISKREHRKIDRTQLL